MRGTRGGRSDRGIVDTWQRPRLWPGRRIRDRLDNQAEAMHGIALIALRGDRRVRSPFAGAAGLAMLSLRPRPFDVTALDSTARLRPLARVPYAVVFSHVAARGRAGDPADETRALRPCPCFRPALAPRPPPCPGQADPCSGASHAPVRRRSMVSNAWPPQPAAGLRPRRSGLLPGQAARAVRKPKPKHEDRALALRLKSPGQRPGRERQGPSSRGSEANYRREAGGRRARYGNPTVWQRHLGLDARHREPHG